MIIRSRIPSRGPQLIAYADRLGGDLAGLREVMTDLFDGVFDGVHVLPFYRPFDGADAGFDPEDHTEIDPRLGSWDDLRTLAADHRVMADLIVNHMSTRSPQFRDVELHGDASRHAPLFLTLSSIFPDGVSEDDLARIYRPRPGLPFTTMTLGGRRRLVWTTFTSEQVDLDIRTPEFWSYLTSIIDALTGNGVSLLRLDAVGYTGKQPGTDCFMTPESSALVQRISDYAHARGADVLLEVHGHHELQVEIARSVDYVYDFALPPLLLHALIQGDPAPLARWLEVRPANSINVLDTHDGIGIIDVGPSQPTATDPGRPGLLDATQIDTLVAAIHTNSAGTSLSATGAAASNLDLYQVNCTYYDALAGDDRALLIARLVQLFLPGIPQVYYVGLLAGHNDMELLAATGVGRDVNRARLTRADIAEAVRQDVVREQLAAIRLRSRHPAFAGDFDAELDGPVLTLRWRTTEDDLTLRVDFAEVSYTLTSGGVAQELAASFS
ncbi:sucrose phosphorylase [Nocardioides mangrovi]|uniref:Sucrose phosphorylase n=1 Tax=Nocardioides mangrovi TaxID=2874580 RepID=A0ABS7UCW9_9ACTN|nr:sucrose phosphorylase [Nocardioides mangrovi]MBZ5738836.1 sucrose phosphorylase [Nocardioides mangrovi]